MLTRLRLINFKCFEDEDINLKPLTLLSGLNGMGKSTVLQSLLLLPLILVQMIKTGEEK